MGKNILALLCIFMNMCRLTIIIILLLHSLSSFAQKEDYIWLGGTQPYPDWSKADGHMMDFNTNNGNPKKQDIRYGFTSNNTSISDPEGHLLFYFNGCAIMNRHHQVMPSGDSINAGQWFDLFWKGDCMYGYPGFQECIIVNDPAHRQGYYLFHTTIIYYPVIKDSSELRYTYIDMSLDNGKGGVTTKNKRIYDRQNICNSYLTSVKHKNREDWWLLQPLENSEEYLTYRITENGIIRYATQKSFQFFDRGRSNSSGSAKFSPDGTKFALYNYYDQLHVYDFDRETGLLSNHQKIEIYPSDSIDRSIIYFSSVEWSPNSRFVYCASYLKLHQVDLWENDPQDGVRHIADYDGTLNPFPNELFLMAQAPDCKIYMTPKNGSYTLHVINKPDELGTSCNFVQNGIKLPNSNSGTLPNFPRFRVDEVDKCDPTITSVFGDDVYYRRDVVVYPNPSTGLFHIKIPQEIIGKASIIVTDINGQILLHNQISESLLEEIDITNLPAGRYNIEIYPLDNKERLFYGRQVVKI